MPLVGTAFARLCLILVLTLASGLGCRVFERNVPAPAVPQLLPGQTADVFNTARPTLAAAVNDVLGRHPVVVEQPFEFPHIIHAGREIACTEYCHESVSEGPVAGERRVLMQELLLGLHHRKLVTCVIDDLSVDGLPWDLGLPDASSIHPERVDLDALERAVAFERHEQGGSAAADASARQQWQLVARLASDIDRFFDAAGRRPPTAAQMAAARRAISAMPVGPTVRCFEIPDDVIAVFADRFADPGRANRFLALASELRLACNPEGFTDRQVTVRAWEVLDPRAMTAEVFWRAVLSAAGRKSRRSLAAFLMAPGSPQPETLSPGPARVYSEFLAWLEDPRVRVSKGACTG